MVILILLVCSLFQLPSNDCGLSVAYNALGLLKPDSFPSYSEFKAKHGPVPVDGYSLKQVSEICEQEGLYTLGLGLTVAELVDRGEVKICRLNANHFVVIDDISTSSVSMLDGPRMVRIKRSQFENDWDGNVLLVSLNPIGFERQVSRSAVLIAIIAFFVILVLLVAIVRRRRVNAVLFLLLMFTGCRDATHPSAVPIAIPEQTRFEGKVRLTTDSGEDIVEVLDLGEIELGLPETRVDLTMHNDSDQELFVESVSASCSCSDLLVEKGTIGAGKAKNVSLVLRAGPAGSHDASVSIVFEKPSVFERKLNVRWKTVGIAKFLEPVVELGRILILLVTSVTGF